VLGIVSEAVSHAAPEHRVSCQGEFQDTQLCSS